MHPARWPNWPPWARHSGEQGKELPHESATLHVTGQAIYTDDIPELRGTLVCGADHLAGGAWRAGGRRHRPCRHPGHARRGGGVHGASDIPGENNCGPIIHDDPFLADGIVQFVGQPVAVVVAREMLYAREAAAQGAGQGLRAAGHASPSSRLWRRRASSCPTKSLAQGDAAGSIGCRAAPPDKAAHAAASRSSSTWKARSPTRCRARTASSRSTCQHPAPRRQPA